MGSAASYSDVAELGRDNSLRDSKLESNLISKAKPELEGFCDVSSESVLKAKFIRYSLSADSVLQKLVLRSPFPSSEAVAKAVDAFSEVAKDDRIKAIDAAEVPRFNRSSSSITIQSSSTCPRQLVVLTGPGRKENRKILEDWTASQSAGRTPIIPGDGDVDYKVVMPMHWKSLKCKEVTELQTSDHLMETFPGKASMLRCPVIVYTVNFQFYKDKSFAMRSKLIQRIEVMMHDFEEMARMNWVKRSSVIVLTVGIPRTEFFGKIFGKEFDDSEEFFEVVESVFRDKFSKMTFVSCSGLDEIDFKAEVEKNIAMFQCRMTGRTPLTASSTLSTPGTSGSALATPGQFDPTADVPQSVLDLVNSIDEKP